MRGTCCIVNGGQWEQPNRAKIVSLGNDGTTNDNNKRKCSAGLFARGCSQPQILIRVVLNVFILWQCCAY